MPRGSLLKEKDLKLLEKPSIVVLSYPRSYRYQMAGVVFSLISEWILMYGLYYIFQSSVYMYNSFLTTSRHVQFSLAILLKSFVNQVRGMSSLRRSSRVKS